MDVWQYYKAVTCRLLVWSAVSVIAGVTLLAFGFLFFFDLLHALGVSKLENAHG